MRLPRSTIMRLPRSAVMRFPRHKGRRFPTFAWTWAWAFTTCGFRNLRNGGFRGDFFTARLSCNAASGLSCNAPSGLSGNAASGLGEWQCGFRTK
jgi:hypothetical protein